MTNHRTEATCEAGLSKMAVHEFFANAVDALNGAERKALIEKFGDLETAWHRARS